MRVIMLGTAQDGGVPHVACHCPTCTDARRNPLHQRFAPSLGIVDDHGGGMYMIDASPDFNRQLEMLQQAAGDLRGKGRLPVDGIFLTHAHFGHYWGLGYLGKEACSPKELPVYCSPDLKAFLLANRPFADMVKWANLVLHEVAHLVPIPVGPGCSITPYAVEHRRDFTDTMGYILQGEQQKLLYIPDMDDITDDIVDLIHDVDVAIIDGCFYSGDELPGRNMKEVPHPFIPQSMDRLQALVKTTEIVFTHFNHSNYAIRPNGPERLTVLGRGFGLAADGDEFVI